MLKIVRSICCGVDVHKSFIVATTGSTNEHGVTSHQTKSFYTHNKDINILEDNSFNITAANPKYIKAVKEKKDRQESYYCYWSYDAFNPIDINYSDNPKEVLENKREQIINNALKTLSKLGIDTSILNLNHTNI